MTTISLPIVAAPHPSLNQVIAKAVQRSADSKLTTEPKLRPVAATYAAKVSCPPSCPFYGGNGCYADSGHVGIQTSRLNKEADAVGADELDAAHAESAAIRGLAPGGPLRLHIVGDCKSDQTARIVSQAADEYATKASTYAWTYTHGWRDTERASWGNVSVLASCETEEDVQQALDRGYATAMVVDTHENMPDRVAGTKMVACPQQTGKVRDCESCGACGRDSKLRGKVTIAFAAHGTGTQAVRRAIRQRMLDR